jgi:hypothetical protein
MSLRRTFRFVRLFLPLIGFLLIAGLPHYAGRLSLLLHGMPFARVTKTDTFKYVQSDNLRNAGIVVSGGRAVGWIYQPMFGIARFVPFTGKPSLDDTGDADLWLDHRLLIVWPWRWWLLAAQAVLLVFWFGLRQRRVQHSSP